MNYNIIGIIYIGSSEIHLKICQRKRKEIEVVENCVQKIQIGQQAYEYEKIDNDKIDIIIKYIKKYNKLCKEYDVEKIDLIASTAIRESKNRDLIKDRILRETGINLRVLSDDELKNLVFMSMYTIIKKDKYIKENSVLSFIGTGNLGIAFYQDEKIRFIQNILIGTLKLYEISKSAEKYSHKTHLLIKEQIDMYIKFLPDYFPKKEENNFIFTGRMANTIKKNCKNTTHRDFFIIKKEDFDELYFNVIDLNIEKISYKYNISKDFAREFLIAIVIIENLLTICNFNKIMIPRVYYFDILFYRFLNKREYELVENKFYGFSVANAYRISENYKSLDKHIKYINKITKKMLKKLETHLTFTKKEKLYLEIGVILHNVGKFINPDKHYINSEYIVKNTNIIGLNEKERLIISLIIKFQSYLYPEEYDKEYNKLEYDEKMTVARLSAILKIADSLDKNYRQKFERITLKKYRSNIKFILETKEDSSIEQMKFDEYKEYFKEVFGINLAIEIRRVY
ncbi:MAG: HD domain-containing protein [Eubacteriales bacterium]